MSPLPSQLPVLPGRQPLGRWVLGYDGPDLVVGDLRDDAGRDPDWPDSAGYGELYAYLNDQGACPGAFRALRRADYEWWHEERVTNPTVCEWRAIRRPYGTSDSEHTFHVAIVSFGCGRTAGEVVAVLERDPVTVARWGHPRRGQLRGQEIREMLPRAYQAARPCGRVHRAS